MDLAELAEIIVAAEECLPRDLPKDVERDVVVCLCLHLAGKYRVDPVELYYRVRYPLAPARSREQIEALLSPLPTALLSL